METIKLKDGTLRFRSMIWINGRQMKSPSFHRKTDCKQWLAKQRSKKVEIELYGDVKKLRENVTFKDFAEIWLLAKISAGLSPSSIHNYSSYLRINIYPHFSAQDIKHIQKSDIEKMQRELRAKHNAKGTNNIMAVMKSIFKEAHRDGYLLKNPTEYISKLKEDPQHEKYWTRAEINQFLLSNTHHSMYDFFLLALNTGMRKGELGALQWDKVDFALNQITVTRTRDKYGLKETTKTNLRRVVPMNSLTRACLLKLFNKRTDSPYVFVREDASPLEIHHVYRDFTQAYKRAKIMNKIPFHGLRHTFASQFVMNGGNIFDLQKILGHTDIKMTMRYAHYSNEHLQKAMSGFELGMAQNEPTHILPMEENKMENVVCL